MSNPRARWKQVLEARAAVYEEGLIKSVIDRGHDPNDVVTRGYIQLMRQAFVDGAEWKYKTGEVTRMAYRKQGERN